jgi:hypothetical protein
MTTSLNSSRPVLDQDSRSGQSRLRTLTASATLTQEAHDGQTILLDAAAGLTVTLPAANGTGAIFTFLVKTTVTSNSNIIQVANSTDVMTGMVFTCNDTDGSTSGWETASTSDTITLNGTTTGGIKGDQIIIQDVASGLFRVLGYTSATGTEATPFSAAV